MHAYNAASDEERLAVIQRDLRAGRTWGETALWLAGVDEPHRLMARAMWAEPYRRTIMDAAGNQHSETAWRLARPVKDI